MVAENVNTGNFSYRKVKKYSLQIMGAMNDLMDDDEDEKDPSPPPPPLPPPNAHKWYDLMLSCECVCVCVCVRAYACVLHSIALCARHTCIHCMFHCLSSLSLCLPSLRSEFEDEVPPPVPLHTEASTHLLDSHKASSTCDSENLVCSTGIYYAPTPR